MPGLILQHFLSTITVSQSISLQSSTGHTKSVGNEFKSTGHTKSVGNEFKSVTPKEPLLFPIHMNHYEWSSKCLYKTEPD